MNRCKKLINKELFGWKKGEVLWLATASFIILALSVYWKDSLVNIICALSGVICVVMTGKGKISSYIFGTINTILYAYIAWNAKYYGDVMLNLLYFFPMNFVGWFMWRKYINQDTQEVIKEHMRLKGKLIVAFACIVSIYVYGLILKYLGGNLPFVDSASTVLSVFAQILCVKRYMEQWILWILVNILSVIMWVTAFWTGGESIATLLMWSVYLLNAIIMFIKWYRESKIQVVKQDA